MPFPASEDVIAEAERALGRKFPEALRARFIRSNGGDVSTSNDDWILFPVRDSTDRKRLSRTANDVVRETEQARSWHLFPQDAIAIGSNGAGDLLTLLPGSDALYAWDHATGAVVAVDVDFE